MGGDAAFAKYNASFATIVSSYFFGGVAAGAIVGLLRPFAARPLGAPLVGAVAFTPFAAGVFFILNNGRTWSLPDSIFLVAFSIVFGGMAGAILRAIFAGDQ